MEETELKEEGGRPTKSGRDKKGEVSQEGGGGWDTGQRPVAGTFQHFPERELPQGEKFHSVQFLRGAL